MTRNWLINLMLGLLLLVLAGCGSANISSGDATNISLSLAASNTTVAVDQITTLTSTISTTLSAKNNLEITFLSSNESVIPSMTARTDSTGVATAIVKPKNSISTATTVSFIAAVGGARSNSVSITINPAALTFTAGAAATFDVLKITPLGTPIRFVQQGVTITMKDPSGNPVANQSVEITVKSITNRGITSTSSDHIVFQPVDGTPDIESPPGTLTVKTNSTGVADLPYYAVILASGNPHVITVNFEVKTTYNGQVYTATGSTMYTLTMNGT